MGPHGVLIYIIQMWIHHTNSDVWTVIWGTFSQSINHNIFGFSRNFQTNPHVSSVQKPQYHPLFYLVHWISCN